MWFMDRSCGRRCARWYLLLSLLAVVAGARASEIEGLYEAQVPVTGQREAERQDAVRAAFQQVLVKVTGDRRVATQQRLQALVQSPLKFVQQYLYRPLPPGFVPPPAPPEAARPTQILWVRFDAQAVDQLLRQANEPVWGRARPATLVWLAVEETGGRYLVGSDARRDLHGELDAQAQARGIPLLYPLLDLEDQRRVGFADVWGGFEREVRAASARYEPGAVLVGRVHRDAGGWSGRWSLYQDDGVEHWQSSARERSEVLAAGVDGAADRLAARFARAQSTEAALPVDLLVVNIDKVEDYGRAMKYLQSLDSVGELAVTRVDAAGVHFRLMLRGDRAGLVQSIGFGRVLAPAAAASNAELELAYRLLP
jgi:hypothetical protein